MFNDNGSPVFIYTYGTHKDDQFHYLFYLLGNLYMMYGVLFSLNINLNAKISQCLVEDVQNAI